jgi:fluoride exporter
MGAALAVFAGAGLGGLLRHGVNVAAARLLGTGFPAGTLAVNLIGSFAMGCLVAWFARVADPGQGWRLFLTTGLLGGFTTFSAFSLDTATLLERGSPGTAVVYAGVSVLGAVAALFAGLLLVRGLT